MTALHWEQVLKTLRPGSRTVVYLPDQVSRVVDLARRGFRVLVVHPEESFLTSCRETLRAQGLASQMMGAYHLEGSEASLSLAKNFYDLFLAFEPVADEEPALKSLSAAGRLVVVS